MNNNKYFPTEDKLANYKLANPLEWVRKQHDSI